MLKRLISKLKKTPNLPDDVALVIPRKQHSISRTNISEHALKVLYRLKKAGYEGYLVGGGVRDLLLGLEPKDFDVVTDATPEQVHKLFRNSRLIGRRFRLVHVTFGRDIIEVATFRAHHTSAKGQQQAKTSDSGMLLRDNVYGDINEDAVRRDFSVNALYYNIKDFSIHSYAGGIDDIKKRQMRLIGDPETRYREDPVRMLRAVRFAAKLGFTIDRDTAAPIQELAHLLSDIPAARMFEEVLKLFMAGQAMETFRLMEKYNLFAQLFPQTQQCIDQNDFYRAFVEQALHNSDQRIAQGKTLTPAFVYAVMLWPPMLEQARLLQEDGMPPVPAMHQAGTNVISNQQARTSIPRRFITPMREIWDLQHRLIKRQPRHIESITGHPRFRAAYDFLLLREQVGEDLESAGQWWTDYQKQNPISQQKMTDGLRAKGKGRGNGRNNSRRNYKPRRRSPKQHND